MILAYLLNFEEQIKFMKDNKLNIFDSWIEPFENDILFNILKYPEDYDKLVLDYFLFGVLHIIR